MRQHIKRRLIQGAVLLAAALLFSSCLGAEIETRFNADGSGTIISKMRISKLILEMGNEEDSGFDIPTSKEDMQARFTGLDGIRLVEVIEEETEEDIIITATIEFDSFDTVVDSEESPLETGTFRMTDDGALFSIKVGEAMDAVMSAEDSPFGEEGLDDAMLAMMQAFLEGYEIAYRITAPKKIERFTHGELSADGMSVSLRMPMSDYLVLEEPFMFEVAW